MRFIFSLFMALTLQLCALEKTFKVKEEALYERKIFKSFVGSSEIQELKVDAKEWTSWKVEKAVEHGAQVKKGDSLVVFQKAKFVDYLAKKQRELRLQQLNLEKQKLVVKQTEFSAQKEIELLKLKAEIAEKAELLYKTTGRKRYLENLENDVTDMERNLKYQMSELDQLQKMYTQDSLKEESEEIVLQRQKDAIERAKRYVELRKKIRDDAIALKLPLNDFNSIYNHEKAKNAVAKAELDWQSKILTEQNKLMDADKALQTALVKLDDLGKEEKWLNLKADFNGTAQIALFHKGKWTSKHNNELKNDTAVTAGTVIMTLVGQKLDQVEVDVPESDKVVLGEEAVAILSVNGRRYVLKLLSKDPVAKNGFYKVIYALPEFEKYFGMPVDVKITCKVADEAFAVPIKSLRYKDDKPDKPFVLVKKGEAQEEVYVILGGNAGEKVMVTEGLTVGDTIVLP